MEYVYNCTLKLISIGDDFECLGKRKLEDNVAMNFDYLFVFITQMDITKFTHLIDINQSWERRYNTKGMEAS
jgi:hypothetical protein